MEYVEFIQKLKAAIFDYTQELRRKNPLMDGVATKLANVRLTRRIVRESLIYNEKPGDIKGLGFMEYELGSQYFFHYQNAVEYYIQLIMDLPQDMKSLFLWAGEYLLFEHILKDEKTGKEGNPTETYWREYDKWQIYRSGYGLHLELSADSSVKKNFMVFPMITDQLKMFAEEIDVPCDSDTAEILDRVVKVKRPLNREALLHDIYTLCCSWEDISSTDICKRWYQLYCVLVEKGFIAEKKQNKWKEFVQKVVGYCIKLNEQQVVQLASKLRDYNRNIGNRVETDVKKNIGALVNMTQQRSLREFSATDMLSRK